jgi:serine/threonine protein kinase
MEFVTPIDITDEFTDFESRVTEFVKEDCKQNEAFNLDKKKYNSEGAYSKVYDVDVKGIIYAIKVQNLIYNKNEFFQEVIALHELKDTGFVVKMFAAWTCEGIGYILMEKLHTIDSIFNGTEFRIIANKLWEDVGNILNVLSKRGWLHLDVHRKNIMATNEAEPKIVLIDFGLAVKKTEDGNQKYPQHKFSKKFPNITWDQLKLYQNYRFQLQFNGWTELTDYFGGDRTDYKKKIYDEAKEIWEKEEEKIEKVRREREEEAIRRQIEDKTSRVLVLCQRTHGPVKVFNEEFNVEETIIPTLEDIIKNHLQKMTGSDKTIIEYMSSFDSSEPRNKATFNIKFKDSEKNPEVKEFVDNHLNFYDLIVLQTCPFKFIDLRLINSILKQNGHVMCTTIYDDGTNHALPIPIAKLLVKKFNEINFFPVPNMTNLTFQFKN